MSIELPEALIIANQLRERLPRAPVAGYRLVDVARMQKIGFTNRDAADFDMLVGAMVESVAARGNTILVGFDNNITLLIAPEYGGEVRVHPPGSPPSGRHQFRFDFDDESALTVWIKSMGGVMALALGALEDNYMYRRDFDQSVLDPNSAGFTLPAFSSSLAQALRAMKTALVGKDAVVVGLSNATFQDVLFRAGIHPKRRAGMLLPWDPI